MRKPREETIMMDLLKLKISTKFMKGLVAKFISRKIYKQFGYKVDIKKAAGKSLPSNIIPY